MSARRGNDKKVPLNDNDEREKGIYHHLAGTGQNSMTNSKVKQRKEMKKNIWDAVFFIRTAKKQKSVSLCMIRSFWSFFPFDCLNSFRANK